MASKQQVLDPEKVKALDEPLIALTQRCNGDLKNVMTAFFSFLHRRTDFYMVPHADDLREGKASMGFPQGDAEKLLLAAFRQFPLQRMPRQKPPPNKPPGTSTSAKAVAKAVPQEVKKSQGEATVSDTNNTTNDETTKKEIQLPVDDDKVQLTDKGLQIPVGNGGTTKRYKWTQTLEECSVLVAIPDGLRAKDLNVSIKANSLSVRTKQPTEQSSNELAVLVEGDLVHSIVVDESTWTLEGGVLVLALFKKTKTFWPTILQGDDEIDTTLVDSRRHIRDYDESTQGQIRKIMHEQQQQQRHDPSMPSPAQLAEAKPLTPENLPAGAEYIDQKKMESIGKNST